MFFTEAAFVGTGSITTRRSGLCPKAIGTQTSMAGIITRGLSKAKVTLFYRHKA